MDNPLNNHFNDYIFTTEGHLLPIGEKMRTKPWEEDAFSSSSSMSPVQEEESLFFRDKTPKLKANATQPSVRNWLKLKLSLMHPFIKLFGI